LRLLRLPSEVQVAVRDGRLSVGHAKVILGLPGQPEQRVAAERVLEQGLNVRQTEELVTHLLQKPAEFHRKPAAGAAPAVRDAHIASLEGKLRERLGTKVCLRYRQGRGAVDIRFFSDAELERILQMLGIPLD